MHFPVAAKGKARSRGCGGGSGDGARGAAGRRRRSGRLGRCDLAAAAPAAAGLLHWFVSGPPVAHEALHRASLRHLIGVSARTTLGRVRHKAEKLAGAQFACRCRRFAASWLSCRPPPRRLYMQVWDVAKSMACYQMPVPSPSAQQPSISQAAPLSSTAVPPSATTLTPHPPPQPASGAPAASAAGAPPRYTRVLSTCG